MMREAGSFRVLLNGTEGEDPPTPADAGNTDHSVVCPRSYGKLHGDREALTPREYKIAFIARVRQVREATGMTQR